MPYVLLCTGSREWRDAAAVYRVLDAELAEHPDLFIRVGDCETGLDAIVRAWVRRTWDVRDRAERCRLYWRDFARYGFRAAGPKRNEAMVADGADQCRAWFAPSPAVNKGTAGTVKLARKAGIPVETYGWIAEEKDEQETLI